MFKKILSYFYPIKECDVKSAIGQILEINWNNGKLVMDSENANYSYGSLQRILRIGLLEIGFENIREMKSILLLGVAGGSVIKTLIDEIKFAGKITGVEIDSTAIVLAEKYFDIKTSENIEIVEADAKQFVEKSTNQFDLIIVDIFNDTEMPRFLFEEKFVSNVSKSLTKKGKLLFNTMIFEKIHRDRNDAIVKLFDENSIEIKLIPNLEGNNELLIGRKL